LHCIRHQPEKRLSKVKKVLVVDDQPLIRAGLSRALKGIAVVDTADSAKQANDRMSTCFYDVCIVDAFLPDVRGLAVIREIIRKSPNTKVVVMTAYADEAMREIIEKEAYRFIEKPLDLAEIREIVEEP
jgi:DNA-binding NtrC family response regulator